MSVRTIFKKLVTAAAIAALFAAAANMPVYAQKKGGQLRYAYVSGPGTLDPYVSSSAVELEVIHHLYDSLITVGENYETRPMIASSYTIADDRKTFTFKIRKGVKFHDGSVLTSADVLASFERYRKI